MQFGVVIPVGPGRRENLTRALESLASQTVKPKLVVIVCDGPEAWITQARYPLPTAIIHAEKHRPGLEQPRNIGVRFLQHRAPAVTHVAFLDSDVLVKNDWLEQYGREMSAGGLDGLYYAPYEFMPANWPPFDEDYRQDMRWGMFREHTSGTRYEEDLSKGLGSFSGNLVWNIKDFTRIGGFWNEIHHGACEDGELGIRAVACGVRIGQVPKARGWHLYHGGDPAPTPEWIAYRQEINRRDVPMLNDRHPWVHGKPCERCGASGQVPTTLYGDEYPEQGFATTGPCPDCGGSGRTKVLFVVEEDGRRFNVRCDCGWEGNTALIWNHQSECPNNKVAA